MATSGIPLRLDSSAGHSYRCRPRPPIDPTGPRAMTTRVPSAAVAVLLGWSIGLPLGGQDRPADRRRFLDTAVTRTTDAPRRTPIPRERRTGPEQVIVVRNGRVFDGTGAPTRDGTLVITGNRITAIQAPS